MIKIMEYGVMSTPALVIDGVVKSTGKVLSVDDVVALMEKQKQMKKVILATLLLSSIVFANMYTLNPVHITKDTTCFIGDFNPPTKQNKGFCKFY